MRIGILSASASPHSLAVAQALAMRGAEPVRFELGNSLAPARLTLAGADPYLEGREPDFKAAFVDLLPTGVPRAFGADGSYWLYDDWYRDWMQSQERQALVAAWLQALEERGVTLLNPPSSAAAQSKPTQLMKLAKAGLPVPPFVITADPDVARQFLEAYPDSVIKPALGGGFCRPIGPEQADKLQQIRRSPVILQQRAPGFDVRVTAVYGRILSAVAMDVGEDVLDYRQAIAYQAGEARYTPVELTGEVEQICYKAMEVCGMGLAGIDLRVAQDGTAVLLESNPRPGWLAIQQATGAPIADGIAEYLVFLAAEAGDTVPEAPSPDLQAADSQTGEARVLVPAGVGGGSGFSAAEAAPEPLIRYELPPPVDEPRQRVLARPFELFIPLEEFSLGEDV